MVKEIRFRKLATLSLKNRIMTKKLNLLLIGFLSILLISITSCKDDNDGDGDGSGNNGGGNPVEEKDYLPRAIGNTWNYSTGDVATMTGSTVIEGRTFWETEGFGPLSGLSLSIAEDLTLERVLYNEDDGVYTVRGELSVVDILGAEGTAQPIEYVVLDKNAPVGTTWTGNLVYSYTYLDPIFGTPITPPEIVVPYTFEMAAKRVSLTVGGETYDDIIHVVQKFDNFIGGLITTNIYYAEGVGIVKSDSTEGNLPMDLESYDLK